MPAKHIQVARDAGMEAGLASFLSAASSKLSPNYPLVVGNGRRSDASKLKAYTSCFGATVAKTRPSKGNNVVIQERLIEDVQTAAEATVEAQEVNPALIKLLAAQLGQSESEVMSILGIEVEAEVESDLVSTDEYITRDVAWMLLGGNPEFRSTVANRGEAASSGQMFRLNAEGKLPTALVAQLNTEAGA